MTGDQKTDVAGDHAREPLAIWGASGHARVVADILRLGHRYNVVGFIDDVQPARRGEAFEGSCVVGGIEALESLRADGVRVFLVAVGDCAARLRLAEKVTRSGFRLATAVHPSAVVADGVLIGAGTVIVAGAVVNPGAALGGNVIINTLSSVDHDCSIADGVHLAPGVHLAASVSVGTGTFIGIGSVVKEQITVGDRCVIGAGSVVVEDIPDKVLAYGVPARIIRDL